MPDMPTDEVPREATSTGESVRPTPMRLMRAMEPELDQPDLTDPDTARDLPFGKRLRDLKLDTLSDGDDEEPEDRAGGFELLGGPPAHVEDEDRVLSGTLIGISAVLALLSILWAVFGG